MNDDDLSVAIVGLPEILTSTPRLLAWGAMLKVPHRATVKLIVEVADMLPPTIMSRGLSDYDIDVIKDAIEYVYDNRTLEPLPPGHIPDDNSVVIYEYEEMIITASKLLRQILGEDIIECHYLDLRQSRYIVMEVSHGP